MTYITCEHPKENVEVKTEIVKSLDILKTIRTPRPFCDKCKSYLPIMESPGQEIISFWFIRQDGRVKAMITN